MTEDKKQATDLNKQEPDPKPAATEPPDCIYLTPYPNVIFLYPTCLASLVAAVWLTLRQGVESRRRSMTCSSTFSCGRGV